MVVSGLVPQRFPSAVWRSFFTMRAWCVLSQRSALGEWWLTWLLPGGVLSMSLSHICIIHIHIYILFRSFNIFKTFIQSESILNLRRMSLLRNAWPTLETVCKLKKGTKNSQVRQDVQDVHFNNQWMSLMNVFIKNEQYRSVSLIRLDLLFIFIL